MTIGKRSSIWRLIVFYLLSFLLVWQWLIPVLELTNSGNLRLFLLFTGLSFALSLLQARWWVTVPLKLIYIAWAIHFVFYEGPFFATASFSELIYMFQLNIRSLWAGNWYELTLSFRTFLFFLLLWTAVYLIHYWIEIKKNIFIFFTMTILFIAFIDTFTVYSAETSIFYILPAGFLLAGLLAVEKMEQKGQSFSSKVYIPLFSVLLISSGLALYLPKQSPVWPDPVPYIRAAVLGADEESSAGKRSKSGYGEDDSKLGGAFLPDNSLVFEAEATQKLYWKIETKNTYTSKGWEQLSASDDRLLFQLEDEVNDDPVPPGAVERAAVDMNQKYPFLLYPYDMKRVFSDENVQLLRNEPTGKYQTVVKGENKYSYSPVELNAYELEFAEPKYSLKQLRATRMSDYREVAEDLTSYLQLPEQLPERVKMLAAELTDEQESVYEKAKAIERYFSNNGFVYDQQNVAVPQADEDYVDQFVFETKRGYCDNFSTSMAVMLRSAGIPSRWVKGFAPGEEVKRVNDRKRYEITNNEAHSWVEAYMPGIGWMPFEPTIGFNNLNEIAYDLAADSQNAQAADLQEKEKKQTEKAAEQVAAAQKNSLERVSLSFRSWIAKQSWTAILLIFLGLFIMLGLFASRVKWLPYWLTRRTEAGDWDTFSAHYASVIKQLERLGLQKEKGMTLSEYAKKIDAQFGGDAMQTLTAAYEKGVYGGNTTDHNWSDLREIWEHFIKKTSG